MRTLIVVVTIIVGLSSCSAANKKSAKSDTSKPECDSGDAMGSTNGFESTVYKCVNGKFVVDVEATKQAREEAIKETAHRHELAWALRTRVLSADEMQEVKNYGVYLIIEPMQGYMEDEKQREFNDLLLQQFSLRLAAEKKK